MLGINNYMSLAANVQQEVVFTVQPAQTVTLSGPVKINRIVDIPDEKKVIAFVDGLGRIVLDELSGDNYDVPAEWMNSDVVTAVENYIANNVA
jgi:hypothetical protein